MQSIHDSSANVAQAEDAGIISEVCMVYSENAEISEGMCSCVCINDEQCCGCLIQ